jgi:hypothetical protein
VGFRGAVSIGLAPLPCFTHQVLLFEDILTYPTSKEHSLLQKRRDIVELIVAEAGGALKYCEKEYLSIL